MYQVVQEKYASFFCSDFFNIDPFLNLFYFCTTELQFLCRHSENVAKK